MIKTKKQMFIVIGAFILTILLGTTSYAFFNYTRTGTSNTIKTGRIAFNSSQGTAINLDNLFPIDPTVTGIMNDATKVGTVTINVTGDTTYTEGIEYLVSAVNVQNSVGSKHLPISIAVSVESNNENDPATSLGTADSDYFDNRGTSAQTSIYKVLAGSVINEGDRLLVGYIKSGAEGVDGNIVIKAYIDKANIAVSDTYTEGDRYQVNTGLSSETLSECVTHLESINYDANLLTGETLNDFCNGTGTIDGRTFQETLDRGAFDSTSLSYLESHNIIRYLGQDGTTDEWVNDRDVFTTSEWNSLQSNGASFQVKVEANEGTWVTEPIPTIPSCPGCRFIYTSDTLYYGGANNVNATEVSTLTGVTNDYRTFNKYFFLGFTETQDGKIDRAFACGIKGANPNQGTAYCIEGSTDGSTYPANLALLNALYGLYDSETGFGCANSGSGVDCVDAITESSANNYGEVSATLSMEDGFCNVNRDGTTECLS